MAWYARVDLAVACSLVAGMVAFCLAPIWV